MRLTLVSALLASALCGVAFDTPSFADPLLIAPDASAAQRPAPASAPNLGGGFIEFLFGGAARPPTVPRPFQPNPDEQSYPRGYQPPSLYQPDPAQQASVNPNDQDAFAPSSAGDMGHPPVDPKFDRQVVNYPGNEAPGTIIIDTPNHFLYLVQDGGKALRYGIGVGRPGFTWQGVKSITAKKEWPDWRPPTDMIQRRPDLPRYMAGGPENPLGARAMYLGSTLYRIHGSNEPWTIGSNVSSGCIRLRNADVIDLYSRVQVGTKVVVM
jgi:lipoprotein-anchoring transpeptidase ErfK/SrfK